VAENKISRAFSIHETIQTAVDVMFDLYPNYDGAVVFLRDSK
jgi:hypothetical protein